MADREKQIRLFERIAEQRLAAAELLLEHQFYLDAVYLAGYTVECSLKALILRWTPRRELGDA
jgi:HEPN domain-containing protein